jgi:hypothetical protein
MILIIRRARILHYRLSLNALGAASAETGRSPRPTLVPLYLLSQMLLVSRRARSPDSRLNLNNLRASEYIFSIYLTAVS